MSQTTFLQMLEKAKVFKMFMDGVNNDNSYVPAWKKYFDWSYTPTMTFQAYLASSKVAAAASVINFGSGKPVRQRPTVGQLSGTLGSMGDMYQMDALTIRKFLEFEEMVAKSGGDMKQVYDYLLPEFRNAAIAPHKRLDIWALQGLSEGKIVVDANNNPEGVAWEIDLGMTDKYVSKVWATTDATTTPLTDIRLVLDEMKASGRPCNFMKMTRSTFNKLIASSEFKSVFGLTMGNLRVDVVNVVTLPMVNTYLSGVGLPTIEIIDVAIELPDGTSINPFKDDRVVFGATDKIGTMQWTYANESRLPEPNRQYSTVDNVLISYWNNNGGRYVGYELNAFPAFEGYKGIYILNTASLS